MIFRAARQREGGREGGTGRDREKEGGIGRDKEEKKKAEKEGWK